MNNLSNAGMTQREITGQLGISLGMVNKALKRYKLSNDGQCTHFGEQMQYRA
jgi:transposase